MGQKVPCSEIKHRFTTKLNSKMKDRIRQLMEDQHLTQQNFAQQIGISTATLSSIFNDRTKPSLLIVDAIHKKFPQVRLEWLLDGTLPMYVSQVEGQEAVAPSGEPGMAGENGNGMAGGAMGESALNFSADDATTSPTSPSLFDDAQMRGVNHTPKKIAQTSVKYVDKPQRKITEIRIFYDDQTWETFVPKK